MGEVEHIDGRGSPESVLEDAKPHLEGCRGLLMCWMDKDQNLHVVSSAMSLSMRSLFGTAIAHSVLRYFDD